MKNNISNSLSQSNNMIMLMYLCKFNYSFVYYKLFVMQVRDAAAQNSATAAALNYYC